MPNFQDLELAIDDNEVAVDMDTSQSHPQPLRPADEVLAEIALLAHLDDYPLVNGVVTPVEEARNVIRGNFPDNMLFRLDHLIKAYDLLHAEFELRSTAVTMLVQDKSRPRVARLAEVNEDEWANVENVVSLCREGSEANLREAEDEIEQLLQTFGVSADIR
jgi:hypothetical protein